MTEAKPQLEAESATSHRDYSCSAMAQDEGQRADVVLGQRVEGLSRRLARQVALSGGLRIDGARAKPSQRVRMGQDLLLRVPVTEAPEPELRVLLERPDFIYVAKPSGAHTVARHLDEPGCLATTVAKAYPECRKASPDPREAGAVHRLDAPTSGVVAFARNPAAWARARAAFSDHGVQKHYLARSSRGTWPPRLPEGGLSTWLDEQEQLGRYAPIDFGEEAEQELSVDLTFRVRAALGPSEERGRVKVRLDGTRAATRLRRLPSPTKPGLLLQLQLDSGHRHQARVHLAWIGFPIDGDAIYGGEPADRLMLHALSLDLCDADLGCGLVIDDSVVADWSGYR